MMEKGEILTLNNNKEYSVVYSTVLNSKNYVFLINQDDYNDTMFCVYENNGLEEVTDSSIINQILEKYNLEKNNN